MQHSPDDGSRRVKNIAAILYVIVMVFLVGGSYIHQHRSDQSEQNEQESVIPGKIVGQ